MDLQHNLDNRIAALSQPWHRLLPFLKESVANFSRETFVARMQSLEHLARVNEAEELGVSSTVTGVVQNDGQIIQKEACSCPEIQQHSDTIGERERLEGINQEDDSTKPSAPQIE
jgi:hypothetical protein